MHWFQLLLEAATVTKNDRRSNHTSCSHWFTVTTNTLGQTSIHIWRKLRATTLSKFWNFCFFLGGGFCVALSVFASFLPFLWIKKARVSWKSFDGISFIISYWAFSSKVTFGLYHPIRAVRFLKAYINHSAVLSTVAQLRARMNRTILRNRLSGLNFIITFFYQCRRLTK